MSSPRMSLRVPRLPARVRPLVAAFAAIAACAAAAPAAHADTVVNATPGESLASSSPSVLLKTDTAAEAGRTLAIIANATAQKSVTLTAPTTSIALRVRGSQCSGAPTVQVSVDGSRVGTSVVSSTTYTTVAVASTLSPGTHTVAVALTNDLYTSACDRNVWIDTLRFESSAAAPPPASAPVAAKLRWAPPALTAPTTINVGQGDVFYTLENTKDYILNLGSVPHLGALTLYGGRNVVIKGGTIAPPVTSSRPTALVISGAVGTVHVEGVVFDGTNHEMDAIQIVAPQATVQVENVRAVSMLGSFAGNHTDVIQPNGGVKALRVDRLTADSNYQGIFTRPDGGAIGSVALQNVDLAFNDAKAGSSGGYLLWLSSDCVSAPTTLSNIYIVPRSGSTIGSAVWPAANDQTCPSKVSGNTVTFPKLPLVSGGAIGGAPSTGSFVKAGTVGAGYVSPGYQ